MNINRALKNDRLMKGATGTSPEEFEQLTGDFERELEKEKKAKYKKGMKNGKRKRKSGGGRKGRLETPRDKLFFILFYFKCHFTPLRSVQSSLTRLSHF